MKLMMILCVLFAFFMSYILNKYFEEEKDNIYAQLLLGMGMCLFLFLGFAGILGIIVKTFHIWGNNW